MIYKCRNFSVRFKQKLRLISFILLGGIVLQCSPDDKTTAMKIKWGSLPDLPPVSDQLEQKGLAGALIGVSSEMLIVAGGSNFPDSLPWRGGTKTYYADIYFVNLKGKGAAWHLAKEKLPEPLAYSSCVSVNDKIICIGGENPNGPLPDVLQLKYINNEVLINKLTDFPVPISNSGAAAFGTMVYVVGGIGPKGNLSSFYCADVQKADFEWEELPDLPREVSNAVVVSQWDGVEDCVYVLGGRNKEAALSNFYNTVWKYTPSKKVWHLVGEINNDQNEPLTLAAGTGVAVGKNYILLFGGDNGQLYNKTEAFINAAAEAETLGQKTEINSKKIKHLESHPGFSKQVLLCNTLTNECVEITTLPFPAQVTTSAVKYGNRIFIPSGEIRPGVRTPKVNIAEISK